MLAVSKGGKRGRGEPGPVGVTNGTGFSGWNGKRGIRLRISIFFGNTPME